MCGIFAIFGLKGNYLEKRSLAVKLLKRLRHRGPEYTGIEHFEFEKDTHTFLCHERLAIVSPKEGHQPQWSKNKQFCCVTNGEIYNHKDIFLKMKGYEEYVEAKADCVVVPNMFEYFADPKRIANMLHGKFAIICYDVNRNRYWIIRDHLGVIPTYLGRGKDGEFYVSNELKSFHDYATTVEILLPGHYYDSELKKQIKWYFPPHYDLSIVPSAPADLTKIRDLLIAAVKRRLMCDVPLGVLLSGGLDSSIIASIVCRLYADYYKEHENDILVCKQVNSFCIGLEGSPDLKAAREVADFIGTKHHELVFTVEEGIDAISDVIYSIETYNPTTIRASTPMFLMSRKIKALGIKMVLTGEGSDEIFGGYLYFHKAPNKDEFHKECVRKLQDLYKYDLCRANKSTMAWGIEARVPFLDRDFVEYCMSFDPDEKMIKNENKNIEKFILRRAFDDKENPFLPDNVLWRQKEQFSDGVGYNWIDSIKNLVEKEISDEDMAKAHIRFPFQTPPTKEAYYYRSLFEQHFPSMPSATTVPQNKSIACSTEKAMEWDANFQNNADESGRAVLTVHSTSGTSLEMKLKK